LVGAQTFTGAESQSPIRTPRCSQVQTPACHEQRSARSRMCDGYTDVHGHGVDGPMSSIHGDFGSVPERSRRATTGMPAPERSRRATTGMSAPERSRRATSGFLGLNKSRSKHVMSSSAPQYGLRLKSNAYPARSRPSTRHRMMLYLRSYIRIAVAVQDAASGLLHV
jgi:hypothetical protein